MYFEIQWLQQSCMIHFERTLGIICNLVGFSCWPWISLMVSPLTFLMHAWKNQVRTVTGEVTKGGLFFFFFFFSQLLWHDSSVESIISGTKSATQIHNLKGTREERDHWHGLEEGNYWGSRHSYIEKGGCNDTCNVSDCDVLLQIAWRRTL